MLRWVFKTMRVNRLRSIQHWKHSKMLEKNGKREWICFVSPILFDWKFFCFDRRQAAKIKTKAGKKEMNWTNYGREKRKRPTKNVQQTELEWSLLIKQRRQKKEVNKTEVVTQIKAEVYRCSSVDTFHSFLSSRILRIFFFIFRFIKSSLKTIFHWLNQYFLQSLHLIRPRRRVSFLTF